MDLHVYVGRSSGQMLGLMNHPIEDDLQVVKTRQVAGLTDHLVDGSLQTKSGGQVVGLVDPANDSLHA